MIAFLTPHRWALLALPPCILALLLFPEGSAVMDRLGVEETDSFLNWFLAALWLMALGIPPIVAATLTAEGSAARLRLILLPLALIGIALAGALAGQFLNPLDPLVPPVVAVLLTGALAAPWLTARTIPELSLHHRRALLSAMLAVPAAILTGLLILSGIWLISLLFGAASSLDDWLSFRPVYTGIWTLTVLMGVLIVRDGRPEALANWFWRLMLPVGLAVGVAALASVPVMGWSGLRSVHSPSMALAILSLLLIMTAGRESPEDGRWLRAARYLALPLALMAAVALGLRVAQYGWTQPRAYAAVPVLVAVLGAARAIWMMHSPRLRLDEGLMVGMTPLLCLATLSFATLPRGGDRFAVTPPDTRPQRLMVLPKGESLPPDFITSHLDYDCRDRDCQFVMIDLDGDGTREIIFLTQYVVYKHIDGGWTTTHSLGNTEQADPETAAPLFRDNAPLTLKPRTEQDLVIGDQVFPLKPY